MVEVFGHFIEEIPDNSEHLTLAFSPIVLARKRRWRNNGLSADFIGDYLRVFFIGHYMRRGNDQSASHELEEGVKYIANELLENAMKFSDPTVQYSTHISLYLLEEELIFYVTNTVCPQAVADFKALVKMILETDDVQTLYFSQMEANALDENSAQSGLGFLSMICDHSAQLSWKFETLDNPAATLVTTMAVLKI